MSVFRYIDAIFSDFIIDFDIFSDDENETKNRPQYYLERDIKIHYERLQIINVILNIINI